MATTTGTGRADRARQIVEGIGEGFLSLDASWRVTDCNGVMAGFLKGKREDLLGRDFWEVFGAEMDSPLGQLAQRVAATRTPEEAEVASTKLGAEWLLFARVFPLEDGLGALWRDITQARAAQLRLAESEARYRELADGNPAAAWLSRPDGELEFINQAMADTVGRSREALLADGWMQAIDPDDRQSMLEARADAWETHRAFHYEGRFRHADGTLRIVQLHGLPRFDNEGTFLGYVGMATDVTDHRAAERRQMLLINELNHRVKNTLVTVLSLVRQTMREGADTKEVEGLLTERLMALSAAHDVLNQENWDGAELADIARAAVKPFADARRISIAGPQVRLAPKMAIALSMALHELATNALKHGALSTSTGLVGLSWTTSGETVALEWRESEGPAVIAPERAGFGSRLLGRGLAGELGEPAELIYAPDGLICRMRAPAENSGGPRLGA